MKRTTILADEALLLEVKDLADREGRSVTALVQDALREYIQAHRRPRELSIIGIGRSGDPTVSQRVHEILAAEVDPIHGLWPGRLSKSRGGAPANAER